MLALSLCLFFLVGCGYDEMDDIETGMFYKREVQGQGGKDMIPEKKKKPGFKFGFSVEDESEDTSDETEGSEESTAASGDESQESGESGNEGGGAPDSQTGSN